MNLPLKWQGGSEPSPLAHVIPIAIEEGRRRTPLLIGMFAGIALAALAIGMVLPQKYTSRTVIFVEDSNIIGPLMEGRAVPTGVNNRAAITRQVAFSSRVMQEILRTGGWMAESPSKIKQADLTEDIIARTRVTNPGEHLIQITYTDSDPRRAYRVTKRFADMVISESLATKERESREAFEFIDSQVRQYHSKLTDAENKLEQYRRTNPDARNGIEADVNARIGELRRQVETARMELGDQLSQETALQAQLSDENQVVRIQTHTGQLFARLAELEAERERLLVSFTERHPDVVRVQHQIADLQEELRRDETLVRAPASTNSRQVGENAAMNPLYGELRSRLAETRSRTAAIRARISSGQALLDQELGRSRWIASSESKIAELTRDYEVNRDLYQDLLRRRENARVSMNLDAESRGLSFRIEEPASIPVQASGVRLMHVAAGGLGLALFAPMGLLFAFVKLDPRVRSARQFEGNTHFPLLTVVPTYVTRRDRQLRTGRLMLGAGLCAAVFAIYGAVYLFKLAT
jgi:polysaccharide chain length determinant protein (PEP-CTERM system associated)